MKYLYNYNIYNLNENIIQAKKLLNEKELKDILEILLSPDDKYTSIDNDDKYNELYGEIKINKEKELKNKYLIGLFSKLYKEKEATLNSLKNILNEIDNNRNKLNRLEIKNNKTGETIQLSNILNIFNYKGMDNRKLDKVLLDSFRDLNKKINTFEWVRYMPNTLRKQYDSNPNKLNDIVNSDEFKELSKDKQDNIYKKYFFGEGDKLGKISKYKDLNTFINDLQLEINNILEGVDHDSILNKIINTKDTKLVYDKDNIIVAEIFTYGSSQELGEKSSWCISYDEDMWNNYMELDEFKTMYFLWNFNLPFSDNKSKIGINVNLDKTFNAVYLKNDEAFKNNFNDYCQEYNIDLNIFKPLNQIEINNRCEKILNSKYTTNNLKNIIQHGKEPYQEKAWNLFINMKYDNYDLIDIIINGKEPYAEKAWDLLINMKYDKDDLKDIINDGKEPYVEKAWNLLINRKYNIYDLRYIINHGKEPYQEKAWNLFINMKYDKDELRNIIKYGKEPYIEKAEELLKKIT
jgi:hypothetical protein